MAGRAGTIARRYARALFSIGADKGTFEAFGAELAALADLYASSSELRQALANPVFQLSQRRRVLDRLLPLVAPSPDVQQFVRLLLERQRITLLGRIAMVYRDLVDDKMGRLRAKLTTARPLDPAAEASLVRSLEKRTGKKILAETTVDPSIIGGVVARVGDLLFDGSLKSRLDGLRSRILT